jgi:hypothetical protein
VIQHHDPGFSGRLGSDQSLFEINVLVILTGASTTQKSFVALLSGEDGHEGTSYGGSHGTRCVRCPRDAHGRIERSEAVRRALMQQPGSPHGRPGDGIDHRVPLTKGGADSTANRP